MSKSALIISALVICIIVCLSWALLVFTVITPLPTKPSATKMLKTMTGERVITDMQMRQRDVAALDAKYPRRVQHC